MRHRLFILPLLLLICVSAVAQQTQPAQSTDVLLTVETLSSYRTKPLGPVRWQSDSSGYFALEPSTTKKGSSDLVRYASATGERTVFIAAEKLIPAGQGEPLTVEEFDFSEDGQKLLIFTNSARVWRSNTRGDYWVLDLKTSALRKLGGDAKPSTLMFAKFSPDGTRVGYVRENNIYVESLAGEGKSAITQITSDGTKYIVNGTFDWVYEEELFCRDGFRWSPDGKNIAYWQLNSEGVKEMTLINNTAALYPSTITFPYPKAGETNSAARVGVVSASGGATRWFEVPGDARNNYLPRMEWAGSDEVTIQQLNRLQNANTLMLGDARTGKVRTILVEKDDAWVDTAWGDIDWDKKGLVRGDAEWIDDGKRFLWTSERDGWRHIYSISRDGRDVRTVTPGNFDVINVERVDDANDWIYFEASPDNATQRYLYRLPLDGSGKLERITPANLPGAHAYNVSPNSEFAIHVYTQFTQPATIDVVRLAQHGTLRTLIDNKELKEKLAKLKRTPSEFFKVDIGEGVQLDGWMIKPPDFDPQKKYPVLFYVYGEPWGQTVLDTWGGRNTLWHMMLAQQGYIVMSVDNRGTPAPRSRAWRKIVYRKMGIVNSQDQANAARAIGKWPFVDASRIGIWGWSGGGSSTLNAMFRYPDVYQVGLSVAPVPNLRYYDTIYQERYGGLPQDHPEEWNQSSPVTFAKNLKGHLMLVHGTGDDNVHYQGTEALINALVAANKQFSMFAYPNRSHGIYEGPGTQLHLYGLFTKFINEKLPAGGRPAETTTSQRSN